MEDSSFYNYRIVETLYNDHTEVTLCQIRYDEDRNITAKTRIELRSDSVEHLSAQMVHMMAAFSEEKITIDNRTNCDIIDKNIADGVDRAINLFK